MKIRTLSLLIIGATLLVACSTAAEEVISEPVVEEVSEAEEVMEEEAMESKDSDDAMAAEVSFSKDIWPILEKYALDAHGGKGGVYLDSYENILKNVEPGNPEASLLYKVLIGDGAPQMPPNNPLPEETVKLFYDWILQGAKNN